MKHYTRISLALLCGLLMNSVTADTNSFIDDLTLLQKNFDPIVLANGSQKVIILGELQARAMVSTLQGNKGESIGWFKRKILNNDTYKASDALGGADRLWFGPEAGPYAVFFKPNTEQTVKNIHLPEAMSTQPYQLIEQSKTSALFRADSKITNYQGFRFEFTVDRSIKLLNRVTSEPLINTAIPQAVDFVAYTANTLITNQGDQAWSKDTGLLSIWDLGAFDPSPSNTVVIPVHGKPKNVVRYFSDIKPSHTQITDTHVFYHADAGYMNKIGIRPENTKPIMGAWDSERQLLTLIVFSFKPDEGAFVSSVWGEAHIPYGGDVINVFNDGLYEGKPMFGPFYELESSSHALALAPGESQSHAHTTMHFKGTYKELDAICQASLGVSLSDIEAVFNP